MRKRKLMLGSAIVLVVLLVAGGTLAWFTATAPEVENKFTAGTVSILLHDIFTEVENLNPGDCYDKIVTVENTGSKKAMVRVHERTVFTGLDPLFVPNMNVVSYTLHSDWAYDTTNNYFYYTKVLDPGATTPPILGGNKICFDGALMGNEYQGAQFSIFLEADAIQATNNAPTAEGWLYDPLYVTP